MHFSTQQLNQLSELAIQAVDCAADYIKRVDRHHLTREFKDCGSSESAQVVTAVDRHCQDLIIAHLQTSCERFDIALLSEENCDDVAIDAHPRLKKSHFWCIDPLDGTLPFIEGKNGYAVSIALVNQQGTPLLAAISLPAFNQRYSMRFAPDGVAKVYQQDALFLPSPDLNSETLTLYCDRSFLRSSDYPRLIAQLTQCLDTLKLNQLCVIAEHGAVVNALLQLQNGPACYIKLPKTQQGGGALWDFSGSACIAQALGTWVSDITGQPLALNQADSYYMNNKGILYASSHTLGKQLLALLNH